MATDASETEQDPAPPRPRRSTLLQVRLSEQEMRALQVSASAAGYPSVSDLVRRAVAEHISHIEGGRRRDRRAERRARAGRPKRRWGR